MENVCMILINNSEYCFGKYLFNKAVEQSKQDMIGCDKCLSEPIYENITYKKLKELIDKIYEESDLKKHIDMFNNWGIIVPRSIDCKQQINIYKSIINKNDC